MFFFKQKQGFTLIEMLVVVSIIGLITSVLASTFMDTRANSRDRQRVADLAQIEFAINAYFESENKFPDYDEGITIGNSTALDTEMDQFWDITIKDPLNDSSYNYVYDSNFVCNGETYRVVLANAMEHEEYSNVGELCGGSDDYPDSYVILIDGPIEVGSGSGSVDFDDEGEWWTETENQTYGSGAAWTYCAEEHQVCNFTGSKTVRYGKNVGGEERWYQGTYTNTVWCDNTIFGDPWVGTFKECQYR